MSSPRDNISLPHIFSRCFGGPNILYLFGTYMTIFIFHVVLLMPLMGFNILYSALVFATIFSPVIIASLAKRCLRILSSKHNLRNHAELIIASSTVITMTLHGIASIFTWITYSILLSQYLVFIDPITTSLLTINIVTTYIYLETLIPRFLPIKELPNKYPSVRGIWSLLTTIPLGLNIANLPLIEHYKTSSSLMIIYWITTILIIATQIATAIVIKHRFPNEINDN